MKGQEGRVIAKRRGFIEDDPLPDRPPEDDVACVPAYYEMLIAYAARMPQDGKAVTDRVRRLLDPASWALVMNTFAVRGVKPPAEVVAIIDAKIAAEPEVLKMLLPAYLTSLAYGVGASGQASPATVKAIADAAAALGSLQASHAANMKLALEAAGIAWPEGLRVVPDEELDLPNPWPHEEPVGRAARKLA